MWNIYFYQPSMHSIEMITIAAEMISFINIYMGYEQMNSEHWTMAQKKRYMQILLFNGSKANGWAAHIKMPMPIFKVSECNKIRSFGLTRKICINTINDLFFGRFIKKAINWQQWPKISAIIFCNDLNLIKNSIENISTGKIRRKKKSVYNLSNCI